MSAQDWFETAPCGLVATTLDGEILEANPTFLDWTGHDLDWLSTYVAPAAACASAALVAVGFIVPHAGQYFQEHWRLRTLRRRLRPLYRLARSVTGSREPFNPRATGELRLIRRETFIRDALLQVSRHLDEDEPTPAPTG